MDGLTNPIALAKAPDEAPDNEITLFPNAVLLYRNECV